ncbi:MAG: hypothetical protein ACE5FR_04895 [Rhodospirillales bacterium]
MPLLRRLLWNAARHLALDPRARAKAAEVIEKEVKPRARAAWRQARPKVAAAKAEMDAAKADLKDIAAETDPRKDPRQFAARVKRRFLDRERN